MSFKYRKKPVVIEAVRNVQSEQTGTIPGWLIAAIHAEKILPCSDGVLVIRTLEGDMRAEVGDYIIRGVQGELYPCKPDIFEATYEKVEE